MRKFFSLVALTSLLLSVCCACTSMFVSTPPEREMPNERGESPVNNTHTVKPLSDSSQENTDTLPVSFAPPNENIPWGYNKDGIIIHEIIVQQLLFYNWDVFNKAKDICMQIENLVIVRSDTQEIVVRSGTLEITDEMRDILTLLFDQCHVYRINTFILGEQFIVRFLVSWSDRHWQYVSYTSNPREGINYFEIPESLKDKNDIGAWDSGVDIQIDEIESDPSPWAQEEINSLNLRRVIPSAINGNYQKPIRRDEFTALMVNVYEMAKGPVTSFDSPFIDIADNYYKTAIEKAYTIGLIDGTSATKFTPNGLLTREQAAKILSNVVSKIEGIDPKPNGPPDYLDSAAISGWAVSYVAYAQENKIMNGSSSGKFNPLNNLTREEAMLVAERLIVQYGW